MEARAFGESETLRHLALDRRNEPPRVIVRVAGRVEGVAPHLGHDVWWDQRAWHESSDMRVADESHMLVSLAGRLPSMTPTGRATRRFFPPPGQLVDIGTHRLHLRCEGSGTPPVVFDAALGASSLSWSLVSPGVAATTRSCTYDRAGFGWSDAGPLPRNAGRVAEELYELLRRAAVPMPCVLVGHSFGGLVMRLLAARHPDAAAALVLLEPAS